MEDTCKVPWELGRGSKFLLCGELQQQQHSRCCLGSKGEGDSRHSWSLDHPAAPRVKDCPWFICMCLCFYVICLSSNHFINLLNALILSAAEGKIILLHMRKSSGMHISHFIAVLKLVLYILFVHDNKPRKSFPILFCKVSDGHGIRETLLEWINDGRG